MKRKSRIVIFAILVLLSLPFLGGSAIWYLGGAHGLDINGTAEPVGRPDSSITVGDSWSSYGSDGGGHRYSSAAQITVDNVDSRLSAWTYSERDLRTSINWEEI